MTRLVHLALLLLALSSNAHAIVSRGDVNDSKYRVKESELPALVDIPVEGHGVLIARQWVVTAAHAVTWQHPAISYVTINGTRRNVTRVVIHPGYKQMPQVLIDEAMKSGDAARAMEFLAASDDIALLKLAEPVIDIAPLKIYRRSDEAGLVVKIIGKGARGSGATGHDANAPKRTELRRAFNKVVTAEGRWLTYVFDKPPSALPLEGMAGSGDSGGPLLLAHKGQWQVAALTSFQRVEGVVSEYRPSRYGQTSYNVRLSHYADWIDMTVSEPTQ